MAVIRLPSVTSGSSPESLITLAAADSDETSTDSTGIFITSPSGILKDTSVNLFPVSSAMRAALAAATAHAPVVKPVCSGKNSGSNRSISLRKPCLPSTTIKFAGNSGLRTTKTFTPPDMAASIFSLKPPEFPLSFVRIASG